MSRGSGIAERTSRNSVPYPLFSILVICPKTVLNGVIAGSDANADQVVEIAVGQAFDVQIDGRAVEFQVRKIDGVDFVFADCERSQGMMKFLRFISRASAASARTKRIGQLCDREDTLGVEPFALLLRHAGEQAEFVLLRGPLTAAGLEFALATMPVQHKVGRRIVSQECGDVFDPFLHLACQRRELHLQRRMAVAVHDLTKAHLASNRFGEYERVERERQLVVFGKFVRKFKMIWNELDGPAPSFGGHLFDSLQARFQIIRPQAHVGGEAPRRVLEIIERWADESRGRSRESIANKRLSPSL